MITAIPAWRPGCSAQKSASHRLYAHAPTVCSSQSAPFAPGPLDASNGVVLSWVPSGKITSATMPSASSSTIRRSASYAPERPPADRGVGVVLLGHELRVEQLGHRLVELAPLLGGVLAESVEVRGVDVVGEPALRVGCSRVAVGGDHGVTAHGEQRDRVARRAVKRAPSVPVTVTGCGSGAYIVHGRPSDVLVLEDAEPGVPGPGEVRVRVDAITLNFNDIDGIYGRYRTVAPPLPFTPGMEVRP